MAISTDRSPLDELKYQFRSGSIITKLIMINVGVFIVDYFLWLFVSFFFNNAELYKQIVNFFFVPSSLSNLLLQPWSLLTYMFFHADWMHILFNMIFLYVFGRILHDFLSNRKILPVYILGGLCGAFLYVLAFNIFPRFAVNVDKAVLLGASAGVMAVVWATATLRPNYEVRFFFLPPIKIMYIAIAYLILDFAMIPRDGNAGGHFAHLGGALFGFMYIKQLQRGNDWSVGFNNVVDKLVSLFSPKKKGPRKVHSQVHKQQGAGTSSHSGSFFGSDEKQARVDAILDKIKESGYDSLSKEEKAFLFKVSKEE